MPGSLPRNQGKWLVLHQHGVVRLQCVLGAHVHGVPAVVTCAQVVPPGRRVKQSKPEPPQMYTHSASLKDSKGLCTSVGAVAVTECRPSLHACQTWQVLPAAVDTPVGLEGCQCQKIWYAHPSGYDVCFAKRPLAGQFSKCANEFANDLGLCHPLTHTQ
jgi:hypothetical protein